MLKGGIFARAVRSQIHLPYYASRNSVIEYVACRQARRPASANTKCVALPYTSHSCQMDIPPRNVIRTAQVIEKTRMQALTHAVSKRNGVLQESSQCLFPISKDAWAWTFGVCLIRGLVHPVAMVAQFHYDYSGILLEKSSHMASPIQPRMATLDHPPETHVVELGR